MQIDKVIIMSFPKEDLKKEAELGELLIVKSYLKNEQNSNDNII